MCAVLVIAVSKRTVGPCSAAPHVRQPVDGGVACDPCASVPSCRSCSSRSASRCTPPGPLYRIRTWWSFDDPLADDPVIVTVYSAVGVAGIAVLVARRALAAASRRRCGADRRRRGRLVPVVRRSGRRDRVLTFRESLFVGGALVAGAAAAVVLRLRAARLGDLGGRSCRAVVELRGAAHRDPRHDRPPRRVRRHLLQPQQPGVVRRSRCAARRACSGSTRRRGSLESANRNRSPSSSVSAVGGFGVELWLISGADAATPTVAAAIALAAARRSPSSPVGSSRRVPRRGAWRRSGVCRRSCVAGVAWFTRGAGSTLSGATPISPAVRASGRWRSTGPDAGPCTASGISARWDDATFVRRSSGLRATADVVAQRLHRGVARRRADRARPVRGVRRRRVHGRHDARRRWTVAAHAVAVRRVRLRRSSRT